MSKMKYAKVATVGRPEADVIKSFLEAEGIDVELFQESVAQSSYAISFSPVQVFVPKDMLQRARELLKSFDIEQEEDEEEEE
ncbi:MAG: hypothetical protein FD146_536 [Anaerolineaceae bacterium]|nr:MAG: hypothetical protein FD146_536 [Anaerolineaceae bacterium]